MRELTNEWIEEGREMGLEEGERTGATREAQAVVLRLGRKRLGMAPPEIQTQIAAIQDRDRLENLIEHVLDVETWQDLFSTE